MWEEGAIKTDRMMEPGESYLLATTYDRSRGWQAISAQPTGNQPLSGEEVSKEAILDAFREAAGQAANGAATNSPERQAEQARGG